MSAPAICQMALKEWAVTCQALARGEQVLLLRKGGIHEDSKDFRVIHREFLLYPTYEHQKRELLQPAPPTDAGGVAGPAPRDGQDNLLPLRQGRRGAGSLQPRESRRPGTPSHLDHGLRPVAVALEAHAPPLHPAVARLPDGKPGHRVLAAGVLRLHFLGRNPERRASWAA